MSKKPVMEVREVHLALLKSDPPMLSITAFGAVPTAGWTEPMLGPRVYVLPPQDGVYEFDFLATPPGGQVAQVISPVIVSTVMAAIPPDLKGVRVIASSNSIERLLAGRHAEVDF